MELTRLQFTEVELSIEAGFEQARRCVWEAGGQPGMDSESRATGGNGEGWPVASQLVNSSRWIVMWVVSLDPVDPHKCLLYK